MNPRTLNILAGGTILVVGALIACFILWVAPLQTQVGSLRQQLQQANGDNQQQAALLKAIQASNSAVTARMSKLAPYDLRNEEKPANVEQARSNTLLTQLMDIFQAATISVQALDPVAPENLPIETASSSPPIASVSRWRYHLLATGLYRDWIAALTRLRALPPTITLAHYKMDYLTKVGSEAKVGVTMDLSFNFLTKATESASAGTGALQNITPEVGGKQSALLHRAAEMIAQWLCPPAEAGQAPGRHGLHGRHGPHRRHRLHHRHRRHRRDDSPGRRRLHRRHGLPGRHGPHRPPLRRTGANQSVIPASVGFVRVRTLGSRISGAIAAAPDLRRVVVRPRGQDIIRRVAPWREATRIAPHPNLDTRVRRVNVRPQDRGITVYPELAPIAAVPGDAFRLAAAPFAGPAAGVSVPPGDDLATMPVSHDNAQIGRAEPFWPIIDATDDASIKDWQARQTAKAASASVAHALALGLAPPTTPVHHDILVLGILKIGDQSVAMLRVDGLPARVTAGSKIGANDYQVRSIASDFVSIQTPAGPRRYDLTRTWQAPGAAMTTAGATGLPNAKAPKAVPAPGPSGPSAIPPPPDVSH